MSRSPQHFKFVAVGDGTVGKTSLLISFAKNEFPEKYVPTVFDNTIALLAVGGTTFELELWDTAGQEDYDRLRPLSYPDSNLVLIVFSLENQESAKNVEDRWFKEVRQHTQAPILLIGTKLDLRLDANPQHITTSQGKEMASRIGAIGYIETSAKTRQNVQLVFETGVRALTKPESMKGAGCACVML
eukprot:EC724658.1.p1 GENE.EC724658.1~~EC724658.1.p1  ORF type:complete len:187 (+),score=24.96 EC724658.1:103-663(+)